jgi:copper(I)-binding protein
MTRPRSSALLLLAFPAMGSLPGLVPGGTPSRLVEVASLRTAQPLVTNAIIPEPLGSERASLYLTLRSQDSFDDELLGIEVAGAERVSLHLTHMEGGVPRMRPVETVELPAGEEVQLRPGSLHAMLEQLSGDWAAGQAVTLHLTFRRAGTVEARARIVPFSELDASLR